MPLVTHDSAVPDPQGVGVINDIYWRWDELHISVRRATASILLLGWRSQEAYQAGKDPVVEKQAVLEGADFLQAATVLETPGNDGLSSCVYAFVRQFRFPVPGALPPFKNPDGSPGDGREVTPYFSNAEEE
jgi:hypothetical protein